MKRECFSEVRARRSGPGSGSAMVAVAASCSNPRFASRLQRSCREGSRRTVSRQEEGEPPRAVDASASVSDPARWPAWQRAEANASSTATCSFGATQSTKPRPAPRSTPRSRARKIQAIRAMMALRLMGCPSAQSRELARAPQGLVSTGSAKALRRATPRMNPMGPHWIGADTSLRAGGHRLRAPARLVRFPLLIHLHSSFWWARGGRVRSESQVRVRSSRGCGADLSISTSRGVP